MVTLGQGDGQVLSPLALQHEPQLGLNGVEMARLQVEPRCGAY
jgi:hypothetical protein